MVPLSVYQGSEKGGYYHEMFLRGKQFLAKQIPRCKTKGTGVRKKYSSKNYLDFSDLPPMPENTPTSDIPVLNHNSDDAIDSMSLYMMYNQNQAVMEASGVCTWELQQQMLQQQINRIKALFCLSHGLPEWMGQP